ncbi:MAG: MSHA biogenesis protein MshJ [Candidatus Paceibacteria bacterium]|jgi:MSHA biogenesis protein MshJ
MITLALLKKIGPALSLRINSCVLRERILLFSAVQIVVLAISIPVCILPNWRLQKELVNKMESDKSRLSIISVQMHDLINQKNIVPEILKREALQQSRRQSDQFRAEISRLRDILVKPEDMVSRLQEIIKIQGRLRLISLETLSGSNLIQEKIMTDKKSASMLSRSKSIDSGIDALSVDGIHRHGVVVVIEGSYLDIVDYLIMLEASSSDFYWGDMNMHVETYPRVTMRMTVFTLSMDKKWASL